MKHARKELLQEIGKYKNSKKQSSTMKEERGKKILLNHLTKNDKGNLIFSFILFYNLLINFFNIVSFFNVLEQALLAIQYLKE